MANKVPPARDFAPAWLKIPSYQPPPPQHASRRNGSAGNAKTTPRHNSLDHSTSNGPSHLRRPHSRHDFRDIPYNKINNTRNSLEPSSCIEPQNKSQCNDIISSDNFNKEFPSLQGAQDPPAAPLNGGVWEKPCPVLAGGGNNPAPRKVQLARRTSSGDTCPLDTSLISSSAANNNNKPGFLSTPLQPPSKTPLAKKSPAGMGGTQLKTSNTPKKGGVVLDMVLVKTPRTKVNKSEFLRALGRAPPKSEPLPPPQQQVPLPSPPSPPQQQQQATIEDDGEVVEANKAEDLPILSSSLEAEQRLLRQMGWKDDTSDDETYAPLTEDELKEIGYLKEKLLISERGQRKPMVNGATAAALRSKTWTQAYDDSSSDSSSSE